MSQAIKTNKNEKRTKKIKPGINDKKALNPFLKKKRSDTAKEIVGVNIAARKDKEAGLEKTRKELAVVKKTADAASEFAESVINTVREPLIALDQNLRVVKVSRSFYDFFKVKPKDTVGQLIYDLGNKQWDIPKLRELLETILPQKATFDNYEVEHEFATIGKRVMLLNARQIQRAFGKGKIILLAIEDITERKHAEEMLRESSANYQMIFNTTLNGMSHCEIVIDADGQPVDYRFLQINDAFETQTGLTKAEVEGRTIREIIPGFEESGFDFIGVHGKVALTGEATQFEQYQEHLQRWYHVQIYSPRHGQFISMFTDITERKRVEQALLESEQRLRRFYESGLLGVIYWNMHGQITGANDKFLEMMGYTRDELERGKIDWINMTPPEYRYLDDNAVKELKATGINKIPFEKEYIRQDGSRVPIILAGAMLDKERFNGVAFVLDITERKRNEKLMSLQSEVLKKLISNISPTQTAEEVVAVIKQAAGYDAVGLRFRTGTDYPFVASLGYTEEFLKAENTLTNKYPDGGICRNEDGTVSLECTCGMIISGQADPANPLFTPGGSAWTNNSLPFLDVSPDADPRLHPRNRCIHVGFLSLALIPIRSEGGIVGLLHLADRRQDRFTPETISFFEGIGISIGVALAHKRAEAAIKQSNERLSLATNAGGVGIWDLDVINDKLTWDAHMFRLYGITSDDFGGAYKSWKAGVHPEDVARGDAEVQMALRGEKEFDTEFRVVWPSGTIRHIAARAQVHRNALGQPTKLIGTNHDITERKQAEEKIHAALKEKELLLQEIHHRVKNNLMTLIGLIKMQETKANNETFSVLLQELEGRVRAMAQVHESLHKSKDLARVDLQDYVGTMSAHIRAQFGAERAIGFSLQTAGVEVNLDIAIPCGLILNELITNAYKHAFPGGKPHAGEDDCEIKVIVEQEGGVLTLTVANNGVGLPEDLDLEKSETLGLRLIKMLSQQLNGSIELDRSAGTAFRLKFPVA